MFFSPNYFFTNSYSNSNFFNQLYFDEHLGIPNILELTSLYNIFVCP